jgi:transcription elongation factor GreA
MDESEMNSEHVHVGSVVTIKDGKGNQFTYTISGATEADPFNGKISNESPVGKAVMGLKVGEKGEAILPNGTTVIYTVVEIGK